MSFHHRCTTADCPFLGQFTDRGCKCHKTPEQLRDEEIVALRERRDDLLRSNNEFEQRARQAERALKAMTTPRPISEYHEDMGAVIWWKLPITEPPYVGSPNDIGERVLLDGDVETTVIGGWPGYHTHFTPLPQVTEP